MKVTEKHEILVKFCILIHPPFTVDNKFNSNAIEPYTIEEFKEIADSYSSDDEDRRLFRSL